jgi:hypothetical protein
MAPPPLAVLVLAVLAPATADAQTVVPFDEDLCGQLSAQWWQTAFSIPGTTTPFLDESGAKCHVAQQRSPAFFLYGVFNTSGVATRDCTLPIPVPR